MKRIKGNIDFEKILNLDIFVLCWLEGQIFKDNPLNYSISNKFLSLFFHQYLKQITIYSQKKDSRTATNKDSIISLSGIGVLYADKAESALFNLLYIYDNIYEKNLDNETIYSFLYDVFLALSKSHSFTDGNKRASFMMVVFILEKFTIPTNFSTMNYHNEFETILEEIVSLNKEENKNKFIAKLKSFVISEESKK